MTNKQITAKAADEIVVTYSVMDAVVWMLLRFLRRFGARSLAAHYRDAFTPALGMRVRPFLNV